MTTSIGIVEDNRDICDELVRVLDGEPTFHCVCACRNLRTAMVEIPRQAPDVVVMDIRLPDGNGIEATRRLKHVLPQSEFLIYTVYEDADEIFEALAAGATGYVLKETSPTDLRQSIRDLRNGGVPMTGEIARKVIRSFRRQPVKTEELTSREAEILQWLSRGLATKEIASRLFISPETVKSHLKSIYGKLQVNSRTEAVARYLG